MEEETGGLSFSRSAMGSQWSSCFWMFPTPFGSFTVVLSFLIAKQCAILENTQCLWSRSILDKSQLSSTLHSNRPSPLKRPCLPRCPSQNSGCSDSCHLVCKACSSKHHLLDVVGFLQYLKPLPHRFCPQLVEAILPQRSQHSHLPWEWSRASDGETQVC